MVEPGAFGERRSRHASSPRLLTSTLFPGMRRVIEVS
jgi:hypothetical protein